MVTDARGHEVPADSDMWGYREDMGLLSASISDVRQVADQAEAEAAVADLDASGIASAGTVWWLDSPGILAYYDGDTFQPIANTAALAAEIAPITQQLGVLPPAVAVGNVVISKVAAGQTKSAVVTFPADRFTTVPIITLARRTSLPRSLEPGYLVSTTASFTAYLYNGRGSTVDAFTISWNASANRDATVFAAPLSQPTPDGTATCPTDGCGNQGVPIPVVSTWTDDETGATRPVDAVECGVCGADITATLTPLEET